MVFAMNQLIHKINLSLIIKIFTLWLCSLSAVHATFLDLLIPEQNESQPITLQLKWKHQFQFAGYYMAKEKGFYQQKKLDVTFMEAQSFQDPVHAVMRGKAQFGVGTSSLLLYKGIQKPVILSVIFQHSPLVFLMKKEKGQQLSLKDIVGKKVMVEPMSDELFAYLKAEKIDQHKITIVDHPLSLDDLIQGKIDVISTYSTTTPFKLEKANIDYVMFTPRSAGIDFYGDNLFTTEEYIQHNPKLVSDFREASLAGWNYALKHPEETIQVILKKYNSQQLTYERLLFEYNQIISLLQPDLIEVGYTSIRRWQRIAEVYASLLMYPQGQTLDAHFLYDEKDYFIYTLLQVNSSIIGIISGSLLFIGLIVFYIRYQLKKQISRCTAVESALRLNNEKYNFIYNGAPVSLVVWNKEYQILDWNQQAEKMFGWKKEEILNKKLWTLIPEHEKENITQTLRSLFVKDQTHESKNLVNHNLTKSGEIIVCEWENTTLWDKHGKFIIGISLGKEVTTQSATQDLLEHSKSHYQQLLEWIPFPLFMIENNESQFCFYNNAAREKLGLLPDNTKQYEWEMFFNQLATVEKIQCFLTEKGEKIYQDDVELITKAAPEKVFQTSLSIIKLWDAEKLISLFLFVPIDQKEIFRKKSNDIQFLLSHIFESTQQAVVLFDDKLNVIMHNANFQKLFQFTDQELTSPTHGEMLIQSWLKRTIHHANAHKKIKEQLFNIDPFSNVFVQAFREDFHKKHDGTTHKIMIKINHYSLGNHLFLRTYADVTAEHQLINELYHVEQQYEQYMNDIPCPLLMFEEESPQNLCFVNTATTHAFGLSCDSNVKYLNFTRLFNQSFQDLNQFTGQIQLTLVNGEKRIVLYRGRTIVIRKKQYIILGILDITTEQEKAELLEQMNISLAHHFAEIQHLQARLDNKSILDELTGVFNRVCLDQQIDIEIQNMQANGQSMSLIFIDIEQLKQYNKVYGEMVGNNILQYVSRFLQAMFLGTQKIFRYDSTQFLVVCTNMVSSEAERLAKNIQAQLEKEPIYFGSFELSLHLSISVVTYPQNGISFPSLIDAAEKRLLDVKNRAL